MQVSMATWSEFHHHPCQSWRSRDGRFKLGLRLAGLPEWGVLDTQTGEITFTWPAHRTVKPAAITPDGGLVHVAVEDLDRHRCLVEYVGPDGKQRWEREYQGLVIDLDVDDGTCTMVLGACEDGKRRQLKLDLRSGGENTRLPARRSRQRRHARAA